MNTVLYHVITLVSGISTRKQRPSQVDNLWYPYPASLFSKIIRCTFTQRMLVYCFVTFSDSFQQASRLLSYVILDIIHSEIIPFVVYYRPFLTGTYLSTYYTYSDGLHLEISIANATGKRLTLLMCRIQQKNLHKKKNTKHEWKKKTSIWQSHANAMYV